MLSALSRLPALRGLFFLLIAFVCVLPVSATSAQEIDRAAVEKIVREYLLSNPELMLEVQDALEAKQEALKKTQQVSTLNNKREVIFNSPNQMVIGNPDAEITVVEFFDYNCGYCKRALADMNQIVAEHSDVKFILKEFPVLGEASLEAHKVSLAIIRNNPELYQKFHTEFLASNGRKDGNSALDFAAQLGADRALLEADTNNPEIMAAVREVYDIADGLGITGTPSYIIGDEVVFGAVGYDRIMPRIANLRQCGLTVC